jgi:hypothetical protein
VACALATVVAVGALFVTAGPAAAKKKPKPLVQITVGDATVYRVGNDPQTIPDDVRAKVITSLASYVNAATVKPLQTGAVDEARLATALGPAAAQRMTGADRGTLVDEGLPKASGRIVVSALPVALTGLADADGRIVVVTARLDSTAKAPTKKGGITIARKGELVFTPEGDAWKIDGYDLAVERSGKALALPTTATTVAPAPAAPAGVAK